MDDIKISMSDIGKNIANQIGDSIAKNLQNQEFQKQINEALNSTHISLSFGNSKNIAVSLHSVKKAIQEAGKKELKEINILDYLNMDTQGVHEQLKKLASNIEHSSPDQDVLSLKKQFVALYNVGRNKAWNGDILSDFDLLDLYGDLLSESTTGGVTLTPDAKKLQKIADNYKTFFDNVFAFQKEIAENIVTIGEGGGKYTYYDITDLDQKAEAIKRIIEIASKMKIPTMHKGNLAPGLLNSPNYKIADGLEDMINNPNPWTSSYGSGTFVTQNYKSAQTGGGIPDYAENTPFAKHLYVIDLDEYKEEQWHPKVEITDEWDRWVEGFNQFIYREAGLIKEGTDNAEMWEIYDPAKSADDLYARGKDIFDSVGVSLDQFREFVSNEISYLQSLPSTEKGANNQVHSSITRMQQLLFGFSNGMDNTNNPDVEGYYQGSVINDLHSDKLFSIDLGSNPEIQEAFIEAVKETMMWNLLKEARNPADDIFQTVEDRYDFLGVELLDKARDALETKSFLNDTIERDLSESLTIYSPKKLISIIESLKENLNPFDTDFLGKIDDYINQIKQSSTLLDGEPASLEDLSISPLQEEIDKKKELIQVDKELSEIERALQESSDYATLKANAASFKKDLLEDENLDFYYTGVNRTLYEDIANGSLSESLETLFSNAQDAFFSRGDYTSHSSLVAQWSYFEEFAALVKEIQAKGVDSSGMPLDQDSLNRLYDLDGLLNTYFIKDTDKGYDFQNLSVLEDIVETFREMFALYKQDELFNEYYINQQTGEVVREEEAFPWLHKGEELEEPEFIEFEDAEEIREKTEAIEQETEALNANTEAINLNAEAEKNKEAINQEEFIPPWEEDQNLPDWLQEELYTEEEEEPQDNWLSVSSILEKAKEEVPEISQKVQALEEESEALKTNQEAIESEAEAEIAKNNIRQEEIALIREKTEALEAETQALRANGKEAQAEAETLAENPEEIKQPPAINEQPELEHIEGEIVDGDYELIEAIKNEKIGAINLEADAMDAAANREVASVQRVVDKVRELTKAIGEDKVNAIGVEVQAMDAASAKEIEDLEKIIGASKKAEEKQQEIAEDSDSKNNKNKAEEKQAATNANYGLRDRYNKLAKAANAYYSNLYKENLENQQLTQAQIDQLRELETEYRNLDNIQVSNLGSDASQRAAQKAIDSFMSKMSMDNGQEFLFSQLNKITGSFDKYQTGYSEEFRRQLEGLINESLELKASIDAIGDSKGFLEQIEEIEKFRSKVSSVLSDAPNQQLASANAVEKQLVMISRTLEQNTAMPSSLEARYRDLFNTIREAVNPTKEDVKKFGLEIQALDRALYQSGKTGKSFYDTFVVRAKGLMAQTIAQYLSFQDIIRYVRTAITAIIQLDDALVDLKKTTSMTSTELEQFYYDANEVAIRTGVTTAEIIQAAANWSRLGYSTKEAATAMAELSSQFAAVSPGMSTEKSQEGLVSIMKAYDIATDDVERKIMDNINTLGNNFAETNEDIIDGLERAGATLSAIGTSVEDSFALFTGAQEVIQNAETVGVALKTLSLRIRGYDEETEQLSEDVVEATGKVVDLTKTASNPQGISLFTDATQTQYKSMVQYLGEISDIWDQLSAKNQTALLENLFGKRGASVGSAILGNFDQIRSALEQMETAGGSADREMGIVQESISYKLNALKQTWLGVGQDIIDRGFLGDAIDGLTGISQGLGTIINKVGGLGTVLGGLSAFAGFRTGGMFGSFKEWITRGVNSKGFINDVQKLNTITSTTIGQKIDFYDKKGGLSADVRNLADDFRYGRIEADEFNKGLERLGKTSFGLGGLLKKVGAGITDMFITMAVSFAINAAITAINNYIHRVEIAREKMATAFGEFEEAQGTLESITSELGTQRNEYNELLSRSDELTYSEQSRLDELKKSTEELEMQAYWAEKAANAEAIEAAESIESAFNKEFRESGGYDTTNVLFGDLSDKAIITPTDNFTAFDYNFETYFDKVMFDYEQALKRQGELLEQAKSLRNKSEDELTDDERDIINDYDSAETAALQAERDLDALATNLRQTYIEKLLKIPEKLRTDSENEILELATSWMEEIMYTLDPANYKDYKFSQLFDSKELSKIKNNLKAVASAQDRTKISAKDLANVYPEIAVKVKRAGLSIDDFIDYLNGETAAQVAAAKSTQTLAEAYESAQENAGDFISKVKTLTELQSKTTPGQSISVEDLSSDAMKAIYAVSEDYGEILSVVNGQIVLNSEALEENTKKIVENQIAENNSKKSAAQAEYAKNSRLIQQYSALLKKNGDYVKVNGQIITNYTVEALREANEELVKQCDFWDTYSQNLREATGSYQAWLNAQNTPNGDEMFNELAEAVELIQDVLDPNNTNGLYGRIGWDDYIAAVNFLTGGGIDPKDIEGLQAYLENIKDLWIGEVQDSGLLDIKDLNIQALFDRAVQLGYMNYDELSDYYSLVGEMTMQQFADGMGIGLDAVQAMFEYLKLFGLDNFSWEDEDYTSLFTKIFDAEAAYKAGENVEENIGLVRKYADQIARLSDEYKIGTEFEGLTDPDEIVKVVVAMYHAKTEAEEAYDKYTDLTKAVENYYNAVEDGSEETDQLSLDIKEYVNTIASYTDDQKLSLGIGTDLTEKDIEDIAKARVLIDSIWRRQKDSGTSEWGEEAKARFALLQELVGGMSELAGKSTGLLNISEEDLKILISERDVIEEVDKNLLLYQEYLNTGDTTGIEIQKEKLEALAEVIAGWSEEMQIFYGFEPSSDPDDIISQFGEPTLTVEAEADTKDAKSEIDEVAKNRTSTITFSSNISSLRAETDQFFSWLEARKRAATQWTYNVSTNVTSSGKTTGKSVTQAAGTFRYSSATYGTAFVDGNAKLNGDWGLTSGQRVLIGELGREIVVNPNTGQWRTYGDNGAEFAYIPRNAIVFNNAQTEQLLKHGNTGSRAMALAHGTAYANGTAMITGGMSGDIVRRVTAAMIGSSSGATTSSEVSSYADDFSSAASAAEEFSDEIDWIEIVINRIERDIENLSTVAESSFNTFEDRNKALEQQIHNITHEINVQNAAYTEYLKKAGSVGLDEFWAKRVREGLINGNISDEIQNITDETLKQQIDSYQQWYEKALECSDAVGELKENLKEVFQSRFENVSSTFEALINWIQTDKETIDSFISLTEARGNLISAQYYNAQIGEEEKILSALQQEREELVAKLNEAETTGAIAKGSEAWNEMKGTINDVTQAIIDAQTEVENLRNSIRQISWDQFDKLIEGMSTINSEADFLMDLLDKNDDLFSKKGILSSKGLATFGLQAVSYNDYMQQATEYTKELAEINKALETDKYDEELIARRETLLEQQREAISNAESQKDAIKSLVKEGYDKQLEALKELISKYTDMLDKEKDAYEYQQKVEEQAAKISSLQKQLAAYSQGNDTEENMLRVQKLRKELKDAQKELEETQFDKYISETKEFLDDLYDDYQEQLYAKLDDIDALISEVIQQVNEGASSIKSTLLEAAKDVGYDITNSLLGVFNDSLSLSVYDEKFLNEITGMRSSIDAIYNDLVQRANYGNTVASANLKGFASGSKRVSKTGMFWTNENSPETIVRKSDGAILTKLNVGDMVLPTQARDNFWKMMTDPQGFFGGLGAQASEMVGNINTNNDVSVNMNITLPNVKNYEEFKAQLKNDSNVEKFIQEVTFGQMSGHGKLRKYNI